MPEPLVDRRELSRLVRSGFRQTRRVGRKVWHSRAVTVLLVLVLLGAVRALSIRQQIDTQRWGAIRTVVVAKFSFAEGHRLEANDLAERPLPIAAVPDQALVELDLVEGRTLRVPVTAGQVLTDVAIGAPKARALIGSIGPGRVALAIPTSGPRPPVQVGDRIDVHASTSPLNEPMGLALGSAASNVHATDDLEVVSVNDQSITVAAPSAQVQPLVTLLGSGPVLVALHGR